MAEKEIGYVSHFFAKISVAGIEITEDGMAVGDTIHIKGHTTDFIQEVGSMQIENETVPEAKVGDSVGIRTKDRVRQKDKVYKVVEEEGE